MRFSEHKYSLIDLQKQVAEMRKKTERNRYDYIEFVNGAKDSTKRQGENIPYENVGQFTEAWCFDFGKRGNVHVYVRITEVDFRLFRHICNFSKEPVL